MNLTEQEKESLLKSFYAEKLVALADRYRSLNKAFFPSSADEIGESFYIQRNDDGNYIHEINYNDLEGELLRLWDGEPTELKELIASLIELANKLEERDEVSEDVSPFIYAMF